LLNRAVVKFLIKAIHINRWPGTDFGYSTGVRQLHVFSFLLFFSLSTKAQFPGWDWAKSIGGINEDWSAKITRDALNNVYVTGSFESSALNISNIGFLQSQAPDTNHWGVFVAKYNSLGTLLWSRTFGGNFKYATANGIATDSAGNSFIAGWFSGSSFQADAYTLFNDSSFNKATSDAFLIKLNPSGNVLWAKSFGGANDDFGYSVCVGAGGKCFFLGAFKSDNMTIGNTLLKNHLNYGMCLWSPATDVFVVKMDGASGQVIWTKSGGGLDMDDATGIAVNANSECYITGLSDNCAYNVPASVKFGTLSLNGSASEQQFIVKYDINGNPIWGKMFEGGFYGDLALAQNGDLYVVGRMDGKTLQIGNVTVTSPQTINVLLMKYNSNGQLQWTKTTVSPGFENFPQVTCDVQGNVYVSGALGGDTVTMGNVTLTSPVFNNGFIFKLDSIGTVNWGVMIETPQRIETIAGYNDELFVCGVFNRNVFTLGPNNLTCAGATDAFVAKIKSPNPVSVTERSYTQNVTRVFPNPASENVTIQGAYDLQCVNIYDSQGKCVKKCSPTETISVSGLPSGMYIVEAVCHEKILRSKVMVQR
jgi:hypothetical protein